MCILCLYLCLSLPTHPHSLPSSLSLYIYIICIIFLIFKIIWYSVREFGIVTCRYKWKPLARWLIWLRLVVIFYKPVYQGIVVTS